MLSCGFDAAVVAAVHSQRQGNIQRWTYAWPIFAATRSYAWPELRVTSIDFEGRTQEHVGHWVFVSNFPRYAGGLRFSPWADPHDGLLDLCILKKGGFWPAWRYLAGVYTGRHQHWADVVSERVRSVHIAADVEVPWQVDGDPGGHLPVAISVVPARLALIIHRQEGLAPSGA
jgi:diacylglycerol kinase family enzyme